ncbi:hypothetical protein BDV96DRAFT_650343 [Lophiotrema nucula]|uniref:Uncharacterized protein n=1 Tax=Lophiotrema nucula TaxID=690887 RepID=A0A6A5YYP0_9PLEO|nr:hypothetical protein BDV96DRAFT_650343 [Lophiotrema nucula]
MSNAAYLSAAEFEADLLKRQKRIEAYIEKEEKVDSWIGEMGFECFRLDADLADEYAYLTRTGTQGSSFLQTRRNFTHKKDTIDATAAGTEEHPHPSQSQSDPTLKYKLSSSEERTLHLYVKRRLTLLMFVVEIERRFRLTCMNLMSKQNPNSRWNRFGAWELTADITKATVWCYNTDVALLAFCYQGDGYDDDKDNKTRLPKGSLDLKAEECKDIREQIFDLTHRAHWDAYIHNAIVEMPNYGLRFGFFPSFSMYTGGSPEYLCLARPGDEHYISARLTNPPRLMIGEAQPGDRNLPAPIIEEDSISTPPTGTPERHSLRSWSPMTSSSKRESVSYYTTTPEGSNPPEGSIPSPQGSPTSKENCDPSDAQVATDA